MRYQSVIYKTTRETVTIEAPDPRSAIVQIRQGHPGFICDGVDELIPDADGDLEQGQNFEVIAECENCDLLILEGEKYAALEDCNLCPKCYQACMEATTEKGPLA